MKAWTRSMAMATLAGVLLTGPGAAQDATMQHDDGAKSVIADRIDRDHQGVGIGAAIIENATPHFAAHGVLIAGDDNAVTPETLFEIGSITKIFTNLLLAQLVLEGEMALDEPVDAYLPDGTSVPDFDGQEITLFDLATHSAGLPAIPPNMQNADPTNPYAAYSSDQLLAFLAGYRLEQAPGTGFAYSNTGTALLGLAIETVTDTPYADLVKSRILDPLGMNDTLLTVHEADQARFASPHDINGDPIPAWTFDVFAAAGGYRSTLEDMSRFVAAASGQVETDLAQAFKLMLAETRPAGGQGVSIGLGWMISDTPAGRVVWHNGITGGSNAFIGYKEDGSTASVVLANRLSPTGIEDIGFHLLDASLDLAPRPPVREAVAIDPAVLENYVGTYRLTPDFAITVTNRDGRLFAQATGQDTFELFAASETEFFYRVVEAQITFERDADDAVSGLVLHQNGQDVPGKRE